MKLSTPNMAILKNMCDLMTRELWGAYEDSYNKRILQLKKVSQPALYAQNMPRMHAATLLPCNAVAVLLTGLEHARLCACLHLSFDACEGLQKSFMLQ